MAMSDLHRNSAACCVTKEKAKQTARGGVCGGISQTRHINFLPCRYVKGRDTDTTRVMFGKVATVFVRFSLIAIVLAATNRCAFEEWAGRSGHEHDAGHHHSGASEDPSHAAKDSDHHKKNSSKSGSEDDCCKSLQSAILKVAPDLLSGAVYSAPFAVVSQPTWKSGSDKLRVLLAELVHGPPRSFLRDRLISLVSAPNAPPTSYLA